MLSVVEICIEKRRHSLYVNNNVMTAMIDIVNIMSYSLSTMLCISVRQIIDT